MMNRNKLIGALQMLRSSGTHHDTLRGQDEINAVLNLVDSMVSEARAALAQRADEPVAWVPVSERMPKPGVKVLVLYANNYGRARRTCAHYSPKHTIDASTWDEGEPDETEDGTFEPEGWWEEPVEIERVQFIADEVTHWMPLPAFPDTAAPAAPAYVPLSDEQIVNIVDDLLRSGMIQRPIWSEARAIARAIESLVVARMRGDGK